MGYPIFESDSGVEVELDSGIAVPYHDNQIDTNQKMEVSTGGNPHITKRGEESKYLRININNISKGKRDKLYSFFMDTIDFAMNEFDFRIDSDKSTGYRVRLALNKMGGDGFSFPIVNPVQFSNIKELILLIISENTYVTYLLTEDGDRLLTEDGDYLITEN